MRVTLRLMAASENEDLNEAQIRKVARLSRLALDDEAILVYREQLSSVLGHIALLNSLDVEGVEPMAHPLPLTNRLGDDEPIAGMSIDALLANAPMVEGDFIAVPKVLGGES